MGDYLVINDGGHGVTVFFGSYEDCMRFRNGDITLFVIKSRNI